MKQTYPGYKHAILCCTVWICTVQLRVEFLQIQPPAQLRTARCMSYTVAWRTCMSLCRILRLVLCLVVVLIPGNATCSFPSKHACLFGCRSATWTAGCRSSWVVLFAAGEQSYVIPEGGLPLHEQAGGKCQLAESKRGFTEGHRHKCKPTSAHVKNAYYGMRR